MNTFTAAHIMSNTFISNYKNQLHYLIIIILLCIFYAISNCDMHDRPDHQRIGGL